MSQPGDQRAIPDPGFAGDGGEADPTLARSLAAYDGRDDGDGLADDKTSDMATVLLTRPDGRTGLLAFTSTEALGAWRADARPVPVTARTAARAALQDGADALVIDVAGPRTFGVDGEDLVAL